MHLARRRLFYLAACAAALPAGARIARAILPNPARTFDRRVGRRRRPGHRGAPDGAMVGGAARPAVHHRKPARRLGQSCPRGGRPPDGYTLALLGVNNAINASLYNKPGFEFL